MRRLLRIVAAAVGLCALEPPPAATADPDRVHSRTSQGELEPSNERADPAVALAKVLHRRMLLRNGRHYVVHCRTAPRGCAERVRLFARYLTDAGLRHGIDPYLLAAVAVRESGLDPSAVSRIGAAGILQLHPRGVGREVPFVRDARVRARCLRSPGACQGPVVEVGARHLARWLGACDDLRAALGGYASGRCGGAPDYARRVMRELARLRGAAPAS